MKFKSSQSGFTLIELLVVIAIIGLLSSVVLASLSSARLKARDTAIIADLDQFATLAELEYSESKTYANYQRGWIYTPDDCAGYGGNYAAKAEAICRDMVSKSGTGFYAEARFHSGTVYGEADYNKRYSLMVYLPGKKTYACIGTGGKSDVSTETSINSTGWIQLGCYQNP